MIRENLIWLAIVWGISIFALIAFFAGAHKLREPKKLRKVLEDELTKIMDDTDRGF